MKTESQLKFEYYVKNGGIIENNTEVEQCDTRTIKECIKLYPDDKDLQAAFAFYNQEEYMLESVQKAWVLWQAACKSV